MGFQAAIDACYENGFIGRDAEYQKTGVSSVVRVIPRRADDVVSFDGSPIQTNTAQFNIRTCEVTQPVKGDKIIFGGATYTVQGAKYKDDDRLEWLVNTYL